MENKVEVPVMPEEQFKEYIEAAKYRYFNNAVQKFKSVTRAIKRGLVSPSGIVFPKRPFNNRSSKNKRKKSLNDIKKTLYESIKQKRV